MKVIMMIVLVNVAKMRFLCLFKYDGQLADDRMVLFELQTGEFSEF